ncbi:hypothetical protein D3C80_1545520 [compost metagenome]
MVEQTLEPILLENHGVVVEQHEEVADSLSGRLVIQGTQVQWAVVAQHFDHAFAGDYQLFQPLQQGRVAAGVVDQQQFEERIAGFGQHALDTALYQFQLIVHGNYDGYRRLLLVAIVDLIMPGRLLTYLCVGIATH